MINMIFNIEMNVACYPVFKHAEGFHVLAYMNCIWHRNMWVYSRSTSHQVNDINSGNDTAIANSNRKSPQL